MEWQMKEQSDLTQTCLSKNLGSLWYHMAYLNMPYMLTTKAQIRLCIRAVWSAPLLFAPDCIMPADFKTLASFWSWAGWFESFLGANLRRQVFSWHGSNLAWEQQNHKCVPNEDSDQPVHPCSLIRIFLRHSVGNIRTFYIVLLLTDSKDWSDHMDARTDLCLLWAQMSFCCAHIVLSFLPFLFKVRI